MEVQIKKVTVTDRRALAWWNFRWDLAGDIDADVVSHSAFTAIVDGVDLGVAATHNMLKVAQSCGCGNDLGDCPPCAVAEKFKEYRWSQNLRVGRRLAIAAMVVLSFMVPFKAKAVAQIKNLVFPAYVTAGASVDIYFDVLADPNTQVNFGVALSINNTLDSTDDWVVTEKGVYPNTAIMVNSCPNGGAVAAVMPPTASWQTMHVQFGVPLSYAACSPRYVFVAVHQSSFTGCNFEGMLLAPFTAVGCAPWPTATPTRTATTVVSATPTRTATPSPTAGGPSATFTATPTTMSTTVSTPASTPTGRKSGQASVKWVYPVPNPNPRSAIFLIDGDADEAEVSVYTSSYLKVWEITYKLPSFGYLSVPLDQQVFQSNGGFVIKVVAKKSGVAAGSKSCLAYFAH